MSSAHESEAILAAARSSLKNNQAGGRRVTGAPIGKASAAMRRGETKRKAITLVLGILVGIMLVNVLAGLLMGTLHLIGWAVKGAMLAIAAVILLRLLRQKPITVPTIETLRSANPKALVGQTQLWLEAQRPALPAPALDLVSQIGSQLDSLATQLDRVDEQAPALAQVRQLVGEHLPNLVKSYTDIPPALRKEAHAGTSPDQQLTESLGKISGEITSVTRQLAEGQLDALAIQTRYLDYKYGEDAAR
jgi:hypothetical protein